MHLRRFLGACAAGLLLAVGAGQSIQAAPTGPQSTADLHEQAAALGYHPWTVLVGFKSGATATSRTLAHTLLGGTVANRFPELNLDVVRLAPGVDPRQAVTRYQRQAGVAYASLNHVFRLKSEPNDSMFGDQWGFHNGNDFDIDAPEGWTAAYGEGNFPSSGGTRVGIIDTGIDQLHLEFQGKVQACAGGFFGIGIVIPGLCQDDNVHGTHVAGTVGATTDNALGVAGTAPDSEFAIFQAFSPAGTAFEADIIAGLDWVVENGAQVVSMSFGGPESDAQHEAIQRADAAGLLLVAAAGNSGDETENFPAAFPEVMSVAATNMNGELADFSTCNGDVEIAAPGEDITSTLPLNLYGSLSGTSMATPHVSGAAALVMSTTGSNADQTRQVLKSSGENFSNDRGGSCPGTLPHLNLANALF